MLLGLQTTAEGIDDGTLDALTLLLLVGFVVSMVVLSFLLARRGGETSEEREPARAPERLPEPVPAPPARTRIEPRTAPASSTPAWLSGVTFPHTSGGLSEAITLIERLLDARRNRDLAAGIALYSPGSRERLANELGVTEQHLEQTLELVTIDGDAPELRSVELVSATGHELRVRAEYADRTSEMYRLVRIDGQWAIDSIERV